MKAVQEETRKGPWTEQEDFQLVCFVGLFGDRRWDFIAKVSGLKVAGDYYRYANFGKLVVSERSAISSHGHGLLVGLNRTGKSCRLRWVNYLHPGLKRGKMTPQEEKLVLELHSKWGNRWSRIARKLPGRTDNEIKNYWRTYMRKKAQEKKRAMSSSSSSSSSSSISSSSNCSASSNPTTGLTPSTGTGAEGFCDIEGKAPASTEQKNFKIDNKSDADYSMDDIWTEIALKEGECITSGHDVYSREGCSFPCPPVVSSSWEYGVSDMLWHMDEEGEKVFLPIDSQVNCCYHLRG